MSAAQAEIRTIRQRAARLGLPVDRLCRRAGVGRTTFYAIANGADPRTGTMERLRGAIAAAEADAAQPAREVA